MTAVTTACGICGKPTDPAEGELIGGIWMPATCVDCGRKSLLADGGLIVRLTQPPAGANFDLGEIHLRPGALHVLTESGEHFWPFLSRHARGDTGQFRASNPQRQGSAFLNSRGNIVSEYRTNLGKRLWVITSPGKVTLLLAPGEF